MSLLHTHVLGRDVKIAHSLLQWRAFIKRTAAACGKTCIDDTNAGRLANPGPAWGLPYVLVGDGAARCITFVRWSRHHEIRL
jgi:hypothetical protein